MTNPTPHPDNPEPYKTCAHIHENGVRCDSPALLDHTKCYFHQRLEGRRMRAARARALHRVVPLDIPPLEDLESVQIALQEVTYAILETRIDRKTAGLVLYALQEAGANLALMERRKQGDDQEHCTSYPSYEKDFGLDQPLPPQPDSVITPHEAAQQAFRQASYRFDAILSQAGIHLDEEKKRQVMEEMSRMAQSGVPDVAPVAEPPAVSPQTPASGGPSQLTDSTEQPHQQIPEATDQAPSPETAAATPNENEPIAFPEPLKSHARQPWRWEKKRPLRRETPEETGVRIAEEAVIEEQKRARKLALKKRPQAAAPPKIAHGSSKSDR
jgi:hypothetical protein